MVHFFGKFLERTHSIHSKFLKLILCFIPHVFHFLNQSQIIKCVQIMIKAWRDLLLVWSHIFHYLCMIHNQGEWYYSNADDDCRHTMTPDVDTLVMDHKKTLENLFWTVKIYPVSMGNVFVVFHILRSCVIVTNYRAWSDDRNWFFWRSRRLRALLIFQFLCWHVIGFKFRKIYALIFVWHE